MAAFVTLSGASANADEWTNAITPYIWASGMTGKVSVGTPLGPLESDVDLNFGDIVSNLDMGAMVSYEGGRDHWVVLGDLIYMNLGAADTVTQGGVSVRSSANIEQTLVEADVGYKITTGISLFAGARYSDISGDIHVVRTGPGAGSDRSAGVSQSWVDPVVGLLGEWPLTEHLEWDLRGDIGGFGVGSDFAWQVMGTLRWKLRANLDVIASYRYMQVDYENDGPSGLLVYNMVNSGFGVGVTFRF
jgi:opacity protein-like surface antigen